MNCYLRFKSRIEIPTFLLFFAYMSSLSVTQNLIIYKTCYVTLGYNASDCALLGKNYSDTSTAKLENAVQPYATLVLISLAVVEAIIPPILCVFLGPWTDKYGRKPLLLSAIGGCVLSFVVVTIITAITDASPWFYMLFLIPMCLSGGVPALIATMLCYITDTTTEAERGIRMGIFEGTIAFGTILGQTLSSFILSAFGYVSMYIICTVCVLLSWFYTLYFIPESKENVETEGKFRNLFNYASVKETFAITFRRRENCDRGLLLAIIFTMTLYVFAGYGESAVIFLYLRNSFQWTLRRFTIYSSINNITGIAGAIVGIFILNKLLSVREAIVILVGLSSALLSVLLQGFARVNWLVYAATCSKCFATAVSPMSRSLMSKIVPTEDSGKVFSFVTSLETVSALVGTAIYTVIYNSTLSTLPSAFNFVSAGLDVLGMCSIVIILLMQRLDNRMRYLHFSSDNSQ